MKVARYKVPGKVRSAWNWIKRRPRPAGTVAIELRGKLCVPSFTPAPNQASVRDEIFSRTHSRHCVPGYYHSVPSGHAHLRPMFTCLRERRVRDAIEAIHPWQQQARFRQPM